MAKGRLPKTVRALDRAYLNCEKKNRFRKTDRQRFQDYVARSQKDLASAGNDFKREDYHWTRIKAYQALFHMLNALLVKKLGYYSKDHSCVLTALLKHNILTEEVASLLHLVIDPAGRSRATPEDAIQDIDNLRIQRNFALYKPKAWEEVTKEDIEQELGKIRTNIRILVSLL